MLQRAAKARLLATMACGIFLNSRKCTLNGRAALSFQLSIFIPSPSTLIVTYTMANTDRHPAGGQRAFAAKDLPPSVEAAYYKKCIELRRRINDIEENNDGTRLRIKRLNRGITKMRLERAFLLDQLQKHQEYSLDESERSSSVPPTPTDKPLRSKRSHRKGTPPAGGTGAGPENSMRGHSGAPRAES